MTKELEITPVFDFKAHEKYAEEEYEKIRPRYKEFAEAGEKVISDILRDGNIRYASIDSRTKEIEKFGKKAAKPSELDPAKPKYPDPLKQIKDMAGVRVITFLPRTVADVCKLIEQEFFVESKEDKTKQSMAEGKIGYQSIHYLAKLKPSNPRFADYLSFEGLILEIQVRTILQHAWAEMEHDIQYKKTIESFDLA